MHDCITSLKIVELFKEPFYKPQMIRKGAREICQAGVLLIRTFNYVKIRVTLLNE